MSQTDEKKKALLSYGMSVGDAAIQPTDATAFKKKSVARVKNEFETRFEELKQAYEQLVDEYNWNKLVYESEFKWEPNIGETYHLYQRKDGSTFLSMIEPTNFRSATFVGSFRLNSFSKWEKVDEEENADSQAAN
jgi:hypothetical protein